MPTSDKTHHVREEYIYTLTAHHHGASSPPASKTVSGHSAIAILASLATPRTTHFAVSKNDLSRCPPTSLSTKVCTARAVVSH